MRLLVVLLSVFLLAAGSTSGLSSLVLEGHELHLSLATVQIGEYPIRHVPLNVVRANPYHSADTDLVKSIARSASQGRLGPDGIRSALYALYVDEKELGFYGLEAESWAHADRWEDALRKIWSHNFSIDRARVHRAGLVLLVVWTDGSPAETWEAVNARVAERLNSP